VKATILYTAAHAHFPDTEPLGGGKAVADYLCREFPDWTVLSPRSLGMMSAEGLVSARTRTRRSASLHELNEFQYARFCREFERATTAAILQHDPASCVVLTNDISEGPDFAALGRRGYRVVSIWHVDVVEYFTKFYLRDWVRPETAVKFIRWPKLVFQKQRDCVRYASRLVVPSAPMRETIRRCYPWCPAEKITVLPWGNIAVGQASSLSAGEGMDGLEAHPTDFVIMTLSRLSPEKGIERLLRALRLVPEDVRVWICGAPAYMGGRRYERKLRQLADDRVEFLGHVTGERKAALLRRADLFVSPSRHESYGLTIAEAQAAGCRIISHGHYGATGTVVDCADPVALAAAIRAAIAAGRPPKAPVAAGGPSLAERLSEVLLATDGNRE
jgi:glycosyltransferase involved in cell wall biosynthesis